LTRIHISIGTSPIGIGGILLDKHQYKDGDRVPIENGVHHISAVPVGGYKFLYWVADAVVVEDADAPETKLKAELSGVLGVIYEKVDCEGTAEEIIERFPNGDWKRRRRCVDGHWLYELRSMVKTGAAEAVKVTDAVSAMLVKGKKGRSPKSS
jgi:hypothetical protein